MQIDRMLFDFEGFSPQAIDVGPNRWAADADAGVWCASWGCLIGGSWRGPYLSVFDGGIAGTGIVERRLSEMGFDVTAPGEFLGAFDEARCRVAHNAGFERALMRWFFGRETPPETWSCTMARATRLGLPASLEGLMIALSAPVQKNMAGNSLSKLMAKVTRKDGRAVKRDDLGSVLSVCSYCVDDFHAEVWADSTLPELEPVEHDRWCRQMRENERGIAVDWDLVATASAMVAKSVDVLDERIREITGERVLSMRAVSDIRRWAMRRCGPSIEIPDLSAETLDLLLDSAIDLPDDVRFVLSARRSVRTSTSKLDALTERRMPTWCGDVADRVCDLTQWGGARTLRTIGRGFQPLNLPRPGDVDFDAGLAALRAGDPAAMCRAVDKDAKKRVPGTVEGVTTYRKAATEVLIPEVVAACLRAMLIPSRGRRFVATDYSGVEMVGTFTAARQEDALASIRAGEDLYCELASMIYHMEIRKKDHPQQRQLGKQGVLGCGFGLSNPETFRATCRKYGLYISLELSERVIKSYSTKFDRVPIMWSTLKKTLHAAFNAKDVWFDAAFYGVSYIFVSKWIGDMSWVVCKLPSGRFMYYPDAEVIEGPYGPAVAIRSWKNGQWVRQVLTRQVLVENFIQAICRDMMEEDKKIIQESGIGDVVLTVYDEIVTEVPIEFFSADLSLGKDEPPQKCQESVMTRTIDWFPNMPRRVESWHGMEYRK